MSEEILRVEDLTKIYPGGVLANYKVNFSIDRGEIHALVGENGAGKSTLMKMLFGIEEITSGKVFLNGKEVHFRSSTDAIRAGIGMVHQHMMLVPSLTVAENLVLGIEQKRGLFLDRKKSNSGDGRDFQEIQPSRGCRKTGAGHFHWNEAETGNPEDHVPWGKDYHSG